jgi:predicted lipoprotein with Yx(FWY)xxD motif
MVNQLAPDGRSKDMGTLLKIGAGPRHQTRSRPEELILRLAGTGLLWATGGIHLDLYLTGYRTIPAIGWLFLLQVIAGLGLGLLLLVTGSRPVAAAGALFALATLGGYLLSVQFGLFGFREVRTTAGIVAGVVEVAAFVVLAVYALLSSAGALVPGMKARVPSVSAGQACLGSAVVAVLALGLLGGALAGASVPAPTTASSGSVLGTANIGGKTVLTNSKGLTLYWFAADTPTRSACNGACAQYWPPVPGPDRAGAGVTGRLGTIRRADGSIQETYDGHPLYTYISDSGPGQANGNNLDLNGGYWHEMLASG